MAWRYSTGGESRLGPPGRVGCHAESSRPERKSKAPGFSRPSLTAGGVQSGTNKRSSVSQSSKRTSSSARFSGAGSHRPSTAGSARLSSMGGRGSFLPKDTRNLGDRNFQRDCKNQIISYLAENGCSRSFDRKDLQSPTMANFLFILNFILERIHPSLVLDGMRLSEELPLLLRGLGYPSIISKNHLLSVGNPHSWPILLGMLSWLIEGEQGDLTDQLLFPTDSEFTSPSELSKESEIESLLYKAFMEHSEEYDQLFQQRTDMYNHKYKSSLQSLTDLEAANSQLEKQVEELSQSSTTALQAKVEQNQQDHEQLELFIDMELKPQLEKKRKSCRELDAAICRTEMQIEAAKEKARELEEAIRKQPMGAEEARSLQEEIRNQEDSLPRLRKATEECEGRISELQMQYNTSIIKLDQVGINQKMRRLAAILPDADCLKGLDYNVSNRSNQEFLKNLLSQAKSIEAGIQQLRDRVRGEISETERRLDETDRAVSDLKYSLVRKTAEVEITEVEVKTEEARVEKLKKKRTEEVMETNTLEREKLAIREELEMDDDLAKELKSVRKEVASELSRMAADTTQKTQKLQEFCVNLAQYLEASRLKVKQLGKKMDLVVEEFHKIKMPAVKAKYMPPTKEENS